MPMEYTGAAITMESAVAQVRIELLHVVLLDAGARL